MQNKTHRVHIPSHDNHMLALYHGLTMSASKPNGAPIELSLRWCVVKGPHALSEQELLHPIDCQREDKAILMLLPFNRKLGQT